MITVLLFTLTTFFNAPPAQVDHVSFKILSPESGFVKCYYRKAGAYNNKIIQVDANQSTEVKLSFNREIRQTKFNFHFSKGIQFLISDLVITIGDITLEGEEALTYAQKGSVLKFEGNQNDTYSFSNLTGGSGYLFFAANNIVRNYSARNDSLLLRCKSSENNMVEFVYGNDPDKLFVNRIWINKSDEFKDYVVRFDRSQLRNVWLNYVIRQEVDINLQAEVKINNELFYLNNVYTNNPLQILSHESYQLQTNPLINSTPGRLYMDIQRKPGDRTYMYELYTKLATTKPLLYKIYVAGRDRNVYYPFTIDNQKHFFVQGTTDSVAFLFSSRSPIEEMKIEVMGNDKTVFSLDEIGIKDVKRGYDKKWNKEDIRNKFTPSRIDAEIEGGHEIGEGISFEYSHKFLFNEDLQRFYIFFITSFVVASLFFIALNSRFHKYIDL